MFMKSWKHFIFLLITCIKFTLQHLAAFHDKPDNSKFHFSNHRLPKCRKHFWRNARNRLNGNNGSKTFSQSRRWRQCDEDKWHMDKPVHFVQSRIPRKLPLKKIKEFFKFPKYYLFISFKRIKSQNASKVVKLTCNEWFPLHIELKSFLQTKLKFTYFVIDAIK